MYLAFSKVNSVRRSISKENLTGCPRNEHIGVGFADLTKLEVQYRTRSGVQFQWFANSEIKSCSFISWSWKLFQIGKRKRGRRRNGGEEQKLFLPFNSHIKKTITWYLKPTYADKITFQSNRKTADYTQVNILKQTQKQNRLFRSELRIWRGVRNRAVDTSGPHVGPRDSCWSIYWCCLENLLVKNSPKSIKSRFNCLENHRTPLLCQRVLPWHALKKEGYPALLAGLTEGAESSKFICQMWALLKLSFAALPTKQVKQAAGMIFFWLQKSFWHSFVLCKVCQMCASLYEIRKSCPFVKSNSRSDASRKTTWMLL